MAAIEWLDERRGRPTVGCWKAVVIFVRCALTPVW
jgi:hypothetical protein